MLEMPQICFVVMKRSLVVGPLLFSVNQAVGVKRIWWSDRRNDAGGIHCLL
jgi:hypothetical protein